MSNLLEIIKNNPEKLREIVEVLQKQNTQMANSPHFKPVVNNSTENVSTVSDERKVEQQPSNLSEQEVTTMNQEKQETSKIPETSEVKEKIPIHWSGNLYGVRGGFYTKTSLSKIPPNNSNNIRYCKFKLTLQNNILSLFYKPEDVQKSANENKQKRYANRNCAEVSWVKLEIPCEILPSINLTNDTILECKNGKTLVENLIHSREDSDDTDLSPLLLQPSEAVQISKADNCFISLLKLYLKDTKWDNLDLKSGKEYKHRIRNCLNFTKNAQVLDDVSDYLTIAKFFNSIIDNDDTLTIEGYEDTEKLRDFPTFYIENENYHGGIDIGINTGNHAQQEVYRNLCNLLNLDIKDNDLASYDNIKAFDTFVRKNKSWINTLNKLNCMEARGEVIHPAAKENIKKSEETRKFVLTKLEELSLKLYGQNLEDPDPFTL